MQDYDCILPNLYVGVYPQGLKDIQDLKECCGITAVLNLQSDQDLSERKVDWPAMEGLYKKLGIEAHRVPMRDLDPHDQRGKLLEAVRILALLLNSNQVVYLHCNAGLSRSPLVAIAYLHWNRRLSREAAIKLVKGRRYCLPYEEILEMDGGVDDSG